MTVTTLPRLTTCPGIGAPLWLRWVPCRVKCEGRIHYAWKHPDQPKPLSAAKARQLRQQYGHPSVRSLPPGPYLSVYIEHLGYRCLPASAERPYDDEPYRIPAHYGAVDRQIFQVAIRAELRRQAKLAKAAA